MKLVVDFNSAEDDVIFASTKFKFATSFVELAPSLGSYIELDDTEGNTASGVVESIDHDLLKIRVNWSSWSTNTPKPPIVYFTNQHIFSSGVNSVISYGSKSSLPDNFNGSIGVAI